MGRKEFESLGTHLFQIILQDLIQLPHGKTCINFMGSWFGPSIIYHFKELMTVELKHMEVNQDGR